VTVKLLPSREEKSRIEQIFENPRFAKFANLPEFQRGRERAKAQEKEREQHLRVSGKDAKATSKRKARS